MVVGLYAGAVAAHGAVAPAAVWPGGEEDFQAVVSLAGHEGLAGQQQVERGVGEVLPDGGGWRFVSWDREGGTAVSPGKIELRR